MTMGVSAAACEAAITKTQQQLAEIDPALEKLRNRVNKELAKLIWPLGEAIKWAWNKLLNLVQRFRSEVEGMLRNARVPFLFDEFEDRWLTVRANAAKGASVIQQEVIVNGDKVWGGVAGGAYQTGVGQQPVALEGVATKAKDIAAACTTARNAGYVFYIGMAAAVVLAVVALATSFTVAPAIAALIGALVAFGVAVSTLLLETNAAAKAFQATQGPGEAFPGGTWPQATN
jgi:hypothetical protein